MPMIIRKAKKEDLDKCIEIRGLTRDNPLSPDILRAIGVTKESWSAKLDNETYEGFVAENDSDVFGFCFGDTTTGEILVLAILPEYEGSGIGKNLLFTMMDRLFTTGFTELWLAASPDPIIRAHGFYRHVGWQPTNTVDANNDQILKYKKRNN